MMYGKTFMLTALCVAMGSVAFAQSATKIREVPAPYTAPDSGVDMFRAYCSACHGVDGTGNGPATAALKKTPTNLTQLKAKNGGKFPTLQLVNYITGENQIVAHGSRDMPMWGSIFQTMNNHDTAVAKNRVTVLTTYIESLQK